MKKAIQTLGILILLMNLFSLTLTAQESSYKTAVGVRLGYPFSVSFKHFVGETKAVEAFAGLRSYSGYSWTTVGGLFQKYAPLSGIDGLSWFYGAGASIYFWKFKGITFGDASTTSIGILGCAGLDLKLKSLPLNLSLDWIPSYFVNGYSSGFGGGYGAISVRYVIK